MADDDLKGGEHVTFRGTDWEVVSLTASAYAASPGPRVFGPPGDNAEESNKNEQDASSAMFMSKHFIFPPPGYENLPVEPDCSEIHNEPNSQDDIGPNRPDDDNWKIKSDDGLHGFQLFDKGTSLPDHGMEFGERKKLEGLTIVGNEPAIYAAPGFSAFEADISQPVLCDDTSDIAAPNDPLDSTTALKPDEENNYGGSNLPCEAWWKRQAISLYNHAKEANTFWSVFVAAALMGLAILGQRWQREKLQLQQLKWQFSINNEKMGQPLRPLSQLKDILVGGHQRDPLMHRTAASNH